MMNDMIHFSEMMVAVGEYYGKTLSNSVIGLYAQGLLDRYSIQQIGRAIEAHMSSPDSGQYMPKIGDIVRLIDGDTKDASAIAWSKAINAGSYVGAYRSVVFDDPIIHAIIRDFGGWSKFCQLPITEQPIYERRFLASYKAYRNRGGDDLPEYPKVLGGIADTENEAKGYKSDSPMLIGDKEKAKLVMQGACQIHNAWLRKIPGKQNAQIGN